MERKPADAFDANGELWRLEAERSLRGRSLDSLRKSTDCGGKLELVYFQGDSSESDELPGSAPFRRGSAADGHAQGWDARVRIDRGDPDSINRRALEELEGGANSLQLATRNLRISSAEALNLALEEVYLDLAPIALESGPDFEVWVDWLCEVWTRREHDPALVAGAWNLDPVELALSGQLGTDQARLADALDFENSASEMRRAVDLSIKAAQHWPKVTTLRASSASVHLAGCSAAQELAVLMATSVHYLRAMERAGLDLERAFAQVLLDVQVDADVFLGIAKLRAARILWARLASGCGVALARGPRLQATTARRMMTRREPMTNALRATTAAAAAALGGAEVVTVLPYDEAVGTELGRALRLARNTQIVLREESHLDHVVDSAGGSWYLEARTDQLAQAAWREFQRIEAAGGIVADLCSGELQQSIAKVAALRNEQIRRRKQTLVGVSDFTRLSDSASSEESLVAHSTVDETPFGLGEASLDHEFERYRLASDRHHHASGQPPTVCLANLGTLAQHGARTAFCRNLLAAGGIRAVDLAVPLIDAVDVEELCTRLSEAVSGTAAVAILCSSDAVYATQAIPAVAALKRAGAISVLYAGDPGDQREALEEAGCAGFLYLGMDAIDLYGELFQCLGVPVGDSDVEGGVQASMTTAGEVQ